jgi:hypothetical protein
VEPLATHFSTHLQEQASSQPPLVRLFSVSDVFIKPINNDPVALPVRIYALTCIPQAFCKPFQETQVPATQVPVLCSTIASIRLLIYSKGSSGRVSGHTYPEDFYWRED